MKFCHVFYPWIHTDRPRCYALMREDYLWSPLQSACSMQHLRSVSSKGRTVWPSTLPHLPYHHYPITFFCLTLAVRFLSAPCSISYPASTVSGVLVLYSYQLFQALFSRHANCPCKSLHHYVPLSAHTFSLTPGAKGASQNRGNFSYIF